MKSWLVPPSDVEAWLLQVPEDVRRAAFPGLVAFIKKEEMWNHGGAIGLAILGCAPTAKKAVTQLARADLRWQWNRIEVAPALRVLRERQVTWLGELAELMAARLEDSGTAPGWNLVDALVRESGIAAPKTAGFTAGWIAHIRTRKDPDAELRQSPYTATLLPMLFELDTMGPHLEYTFDGEGFNPGLLRLAQEDPQVRQLLLHGCRTRLLRGGRPGQLRPFVSLHEALAVTSKETAEASADYLGLLNAPLGTAAGMSQRALRRADDDGLLDPELIAEASDILLNRPEKTIVKAQLGWLKAAAKRHPELACLSMQGPPPAPAWEPVAFAKPPVAAMPGPIETPAQLAEELAVLLAGDWSVATTERVMAALVSLQGPDELAAALTPVAKQWEQWLTADYLPLPWQLGHVINVVTGAAAKNSIMWEAIEAIRLRLSRAEPLPKLTRPTNGLVRMLEHRLAEIAVNIGRKRVPMLLATPTLVNGQIAPEVLLTRVERAERDGWEPWPLDFTQALLRLPRDIDPALHERAARLKTPAGQSLARRLKEGQPDPVAQLVVQPARTDGPYYRRVTIPRRALVAHEPPAQASDVERYLLAYRIPRAVGWLGGQDLPVCVAVLPSHRESVAAWALRSLADPADRDESGGMASVLPLLADCEGPMGLAVHLAVMYGLASKENADRVATVDAILAFGGDLNGRLVGEQLGEAVAEGALKLTRAVKALRQAAEAGAVAAVWAVCLGALPKLLRAAPPRPGTPDLMEVATQCAETMRIRADIAEVTALAAKGGSSRLATEAQRLRDALARSG